MSKEVAQDTLTDFLGPTKAAKFTIVRIHRKEAFDDLRAVYAAYSEIGNYAIKMDLTETGSKQITDEFQRLKEMNSALKSAPKHHIIEPDFLNSAGNVMITQFCDLPTLRDVAIEVANRDELTEVMSQAGAWLRSFHLSAPRQVKQFWPGWMFKLARELISTTPMSDEKADLARRAIDVLWQQATPFKGCETHFGRRHDGLNGLNLLVGLDEHCVGLDLPSTRDGMQLIDAAQLICDIDIHQKLVENEWPDVCPPVYYGFTKGLGHDVDHDLLRFLCRMQFMFIWLRITPDRTIANRNVRLREEALHVRMVSLVNS